MRALIDRIFQQETINFLLTNRVPRRQLTRAMGWWSTIEHPVVRDVSIAIWKFFSGDLNLSEARKERFTSLHDCFIRELKPGARPIDGRPGILVSPCDGIIGATGRIEGTTLIQAKGLEYPLEQLIVDPVLVERHRGGSYVTLRLTSSMYHRFHAPDDGWVDEIVYISGDRWNVNPIALKRVARLFCRNERAVVPMRLENSGESLTLVAIGAILVASIQLNFVAVPPVLRVAGVNRLACRARFRRGDEMGYFQHGSTIVVLTTPGLAIAPNIREGERIRMGTRLLVDLGVAAQSGSRMHSAGGLTPAE
jgi:phosphatidylserine decarboxylase